MAKYSCSRKPYSSSQALKCKCPTHNKITKPKQSSRSTHIKTLPHYMQPTLASQMRSVKKAHCTAQHRPKKQQVRTSCQQHQPYRRPYTTTSSTTCTGVTHNQLQYTKQYSPYKIILDHTTYTGSNVNGEWMYDVVGCAPQGEMLWSELHEDLFEDLPKDLF